MEEIKEVICFLDTLKKQGQKKISVKLITILLKEVQAKEKCTTNFEGFKHDFCKKTDRSTYLFCGNEYDYMDLYRLYKKLYKVKL